MFYTHLGGLDRSALGLRHAPLSPLRHAGKCVSGELATSKHKAEMGAYRTSWIAIIAEHRDRAGHDSDPRSLLDHHLRAQSNGNRYSRRFKLSKLDYFCFLGW